MKGQTAIIPKLYLTARNTPSGNNGWTFTNAPIDNAATDYWKMINTSAVIESPEMNLDNYSGETCVLKLGTFGGVSAAKNTITVTISTNNGSTWSPLTTQTPTASGSTAMTAINLSAYNGTQVKLRFANLAGDASIGVRFFEAYISGTALSTPPTISSLSPSSGCIGSNLTINGTNLSGATSVTIGGTAVSSITSNSSTQIVAVVGSGTTGTVSVTTSNGTATSTDTYTVVIPSATASNGGPYCEGATIQLTGGPSGLSSYSWVGPSSYSSSYITQSITENFDGMGSSATATLPTGFIIGTDWSTGTNSTTLAGGTSGTGVLTGTSSGGNYNFANGTTGSATDRSLGFLTSGSFSSPNSIILKITNNTGVTVTNLTITFDYEKYRAGTRMWDMNFFHGSTSTPTIAEISGDQNYQIDAANAVVNPPTTISKNVSLSGLSISNGSSYYLKWTCTGSGGSTNSQGIGIDNVSIVLSAGNIGNISPSITNATTAMSGMYTLTTTNSSGCSATATTNVVVNPNPLTSNIYHN